MSMRIPEIAKNMLNNLTGSEKRKKPESWVLALLITNWLRRT
jgi:hypothetical protein